MRIHMLQRKITTLILFLAFGHYALLAQTDSLISEAARAHLYPFDYDETFQGEGWDKIKLQAESHKYFLIGEDHGLAEVPLLTKHLIQHVNYELFVTEIDSVTAALSKQLTSQTKAQIDSFHKHNPSALSFYSAKEEFELLGELAKSNADVWGLDQVSLFSTGIVLRRLSELCQSKEAKMLTADLANLSDQLFNEATRTANYDTLFMFSSKQQVFDQLRKALQNESLEAKSIFNDLEMSWKIYNGVGGANYHTRIRGMKSKLLSYHLDRASNGKRYDKVLYKFGAYHVRKAESIFGIYDVGNFVFNIAEAEGASSYHLMVVGKKGEMNTFFLTEGMESVSFDITDKESALHGLLPLADLVDEKNWAFFDLAPLRRLMRKGELVVENTFLKKTLNGYDGLVIIPEATASVGL